MIDPKGAYLIIGMMSGSSMDGLDLAACRLTFSDRKWTFDIIAADTVAYTPNMGRELRDLNGSTNSHLNDHASLELGRFYGSCAEAFIQHHQLSQVDAIASHGHTILHQPHAGITLQLGNAHAMAHATGIPVIYDFRQQDIDAGGQGAPLVPVCDALLFPAYDACINLGGIANISLVSDGKRIGYDICAANQLLNFLAQQTGLDFDEDGSMARSGNIIPELLNSMNRVSFLFQAPPRSLDNQFIQEHWLRLLDTRIYTIPDLLCTCTEHIALQIKQHLPQPPKSDLSVLLTGGGACNTYLVERMSHLSGVSLSLPASEIIHYKEALAMALMGALRLRNEPNFLPSVTGASQAVCGGKIEWPPAS